MFAELMPEVSHCLRLALNFSMTSAAFHYRVPDCTANIGTLIIKGANFFADGGGIRGYSALLIIQELMRAIGRIELTYASGPNKADGR